MQASKKIVHTSLGHVPWSSVMVTTIRCRFVVAVIVIVAVVAALLLFLIFSSMETETDTLFCKTKKKG